MLRYKKETTQVKKYGGGGNGAQGRIRTTDTRIFSPLLYQLSYLGLPKSMDTRGASHKPSCPQGPGL